jgi:hypothetical protein
MRDVIRRALWRVNFIDALQLVGQASARLPFGVPDPVLHGSSAVELYTGGLWSAADLDLYALEPRPLIAELFSMGFRWAKRPGRGGRGLWHPKLHIGINIGSGGTPSDLAELSNVLTVINDLDLEQRAQSSLKVIGIEDLIAAQVAGCLMLRTPYSESASLTQVLIALAREGVGGPVSCRLSPASRHVGYRRCSRPRGAVVWASGGMRSGATLHGADPHAGIDRFLARQVWLLVRSAAFSGGMFTA